MHHSTRHSTARTPLRGNAPAPGSPAAFALAAGLLAFAAVPAALAVDKLVVVGLTKDKAVVEVDGKRRVLTLGEESPEGLRLRSADSREAVIDVDGKTGTYRVGTHITSAFKAPAEQPKLRIFPDPRGMYFTDGTINGTPIRFLVDTGATTIALDKAQARSLGINYRLDGQAGMVSTASNVVKAYRIRLSTVKVGPITLRDVEAAVLDADAPGSDALLGMSFLSRINMNRDGNVMELQAK
jgi:aspartyl protease family protein